MIKTLLAEERRRRGRTLLSVVEIWPHLSTYSKVPTPSHSNVPDGPRKAGPPCIPREETCSDIFKDFHPWQWRHPNLISGIQTQLLRK